MIDLSVEAEAFGAALQLFDDEVPAVTGALVTNMPEAEMLKIPPVGAGRTGVYVDAVKKACVCIQDRPIFAGVIGPFSLAGQLMDVAEAMVNCYTELEMVHCVLEKATAFLIQYVEAYKKSRRKRRCYGGAVGGAVAAGACSEIFKSICAGNRAKTQDTDFLVIYHNCGNNAIQMIDSILETGCGAYHFGNAVSMREMLGCIPQDIIVMGNVDPAVQFRNGTPESVKKETKRILRECAAYPNFVISSGCDIPPQSPWENIDAFFAVVEEFYAEQ